MSTKYMILFFESGRKMGRWDGWPVLTVELERG
jgi:hypothetical protein